MNGALVFGAENKAAPETHAIHALGFNHVIGIHLRN